MTYGRITKFIDKFEGLRQAERPFGEWKGGKQADGTLTMPWINYEKTVNAFCREFYKFLDINPGMRISGYSEFLKERGILKERGGLAEPDDYSQTDGITAVTMILWIVNGDRFCEGLLNEYLTDGTIGRCLERLKAIDVHGLPKKRKIIDN